MPEDTPLFFGLDLASSPAKPSSAAVALTEELGVAFCHFLGDDDQIIQTIASLQPRLVAIDAPLSLPVGLCCLEESCPCSSLNKTRKAERELHQLGIHCYWTTKKADKYFKPLVNRGMKLGRELRERRYEVIEIYPYATKFRLWEEFRLQGDKRPPKKTTRKGLKYLHEKLALLSISDLPWEKLNHDLADATLAAYTAYLHSLGQTEVLGGGEEGGIVIPKVS